MSDQAPIPGDTKESMKALGIGDFKGINTFQADQTGTVYGIIAQAKGMTLSLAPKIDANPFLPIIGLFVRARVQKAEEWANLEDAFSTFGLPELLLKTDKHGSTEFYVPVALSPVTPYEVNKIITDNGLVANIVGEIANRIEGAGLKLLVTREVITDYLNGQLQDTLPSEQPKPFSEFPLFVGLDEIKKGVFQLANEAGLLKKIDKSE